MLRSARRARLEARTTTMHILDGDRRPGSAPQGRPPGDRARVLARPFALHDRDHRQLLVRQAIGLHVTQDRNREQSRRPHRPIGCSNGPARLVGATTLRVPPTPERPLSPCLISTLSHSPEAIAAAAWRTWIMNEQPPTAVPSTHLGVRPR